MSLPRFEFVVPSSVEEACSLADPGSAFLAGGTDLLPAMKHRLREPRRLISLSGLSELKGIEASADDGIRLGAAVTLAELIDWAAETPRWMGLAAAVRQTSSPLLRNAGTVGGNLRIDTRCTFYNQPVIFRERWGPCFKLGGSVCHAVRRSERCHAVYCGDLAGPLVALDAQVGVAGSSGRRQMSVADMFSGDAATPSTLSWDEVVTDVRIPGAGRPFLIDYQKCRLRDSIDFPLVGVSVCLWWERGFDTDARPVITAARVALSAAGPAPLLVPEAGALLEGQRLTSDLAVRAAEPLGAALGREAAFVGNAAAGAAYRRNMITVLARRALRALAAQTD